MPSVLTWLLAAVILLVPPLSVAGLVLGARRLRERGASSPRLGAYGLAALVGILVVARTSAPSSSPRIRSA